MLIEPVCLRSPVKIFGLTPDENTLVVDDIGDGGDVDGGGEIDACVGTISWTTLSDADFSDADDVWWYSLYLNSRIKVVEIFLEKFSSLLPRSRLDGGFLLFDSSFFTKLSSFFSLFSFNERLSIAIGCKSSLISCDFSSWLLLLSSVIIDPVSSFDDDVRVNDERCFGLKKWHLIFNDEVVFNIISSSNSSVIFPAEILFNCSLE